RVSVAVVTVTESVIGGNSVGNKLVSEILVQLGKMGWLLGDLPHLLSGSMRLSVYRCPACGKVEFFSFEPLGSEEEDHIAQTRCPRCKQMHDMDDPKCPFCGYDYR
ncbi:MAG: hypothetical protein IKM00_07190, partial [Clostridia bacterium]|nr:hypothetical protein [Clostridia bacterium]